MKPQKVGVLFLIVLLFVNIVYAQSCSPDGFIGEGKAEDDFTVIVACPTCNFINMSVLSPNKTIVIDNVEMTQSGNNYQYIIPGSNLSEIGTYFISGGDNTSPLGLCFTITPTGFLLDTPQAILYIVFIVVMLFIFLLLLWGALIIPYKNQRSEEGFTININDMKYLKIFCIVFAYLSLYAITGMSKSIMENYLFFNNASQFFSALHWILLTGLLPGILLALFLMVYNFFTDKKLAKMIERGVSVK